MTTTRPEIVVVGASLGGLYAMRALLAGLPPEFSLPVVLAQHRRPDADSRLSEILGDACPFPVIEPEDREKLLGGRLYVAPANYHLLVGRDTLWLTVDAPVWFSRPSIDVLFESAAEAFGAAAVGIVLTGSNEDGAAGCPGHQARRRRGAGARSRHLRKPGRLPGRDGRHPGGCRVAGAGAVATSGATGGWSVGRTVPLRIYRALLSASSLHIRCTFYVTEFPPLRGAG